MDVSEYQTGTRATAIYGESTDTLLDKEFDIIGTFIDLSYVTLKLNGEAGEIAEEIGKLLRDDYGEMKSEREEKIIKEIGDLCWYLSQLCNELGISLESVMEDNLAKLQKRQREGKLHGSGSDR